MEGKLNGNYLRLIPGLDLENNELIGELKMAAGLVILIDVGYEVHLER